MKTCFNCHTENADNADFCTNCGQKLQEYTIKWKTSRSFLAFLKLKLYTLLVIVPFIALFLSCLYGYKTRVDNWGFEAMNYILLGVIIFSVSIAIIIFVYIKSYRLIKALDLVEKRISPDKIVSRYGKYGLYYIKFYFVKKLIPADYDMIQPVSEIYYLVKLNEKFGLYNREKEQMILVPEYDKIEIQPDGSIMAILKKKKIMI